MRRKVFRHTKTSNNPNPTMHNHTLETRLSKLVASYLFNGQTLLPNCVLTKNAPTSEPPRKPYTNTAGNVINKLSQSKRNSHRLTPWTQSTNSASPTIVHAPLARNASPLTEWYDDIYAKPNARTWCEPRPRPRPLPPHQCRKHVDVNSHYPTLLNTAMVRRAKAATRRSTELPLSTFTSGMALVQYWDESTLPLKLNLLRRIA